MMIWLTLALLHGLYWGLGVLVFRLCLPSTPIRTIRSPHWFAAYFLGLVPNVVVAFCLNQFGRVHLSLGVLVVLAGLLLVIGRCSLRERNGKHSDHGLNGHYPNWSLGDFAVLGFTIVVFARRYAFDQSLIDWDMQMYHLPLAQQIRDGHFPADIGRSYIRQMEAAYPPLFYFMNGLNAHIPRPDVTFLMPRVMITIVDALSCATTFYLARDCLKINRRWALMTVFVTSLLINCDPLTQRVNPNVQSVTTLYFMLAMYYSWTAFRIDDEKKEMRDLSFVPASLFWAGCYWNNYLGLPLVGLFFAGIAVGEIWARGWQKAPSIDLHKYIAAACIVAVIVGVHLLRNWMVIGNPFYPGFLNIFGGRDITEWYLENRPAVASPIEKDWRFIPASLAVGRPMTFVILAATTALLFRWKSSIPRTMLFTVLAGFLVVWFQLLHLQWTPIHRYLYPVTPLAVCILAAHIADLRHQHGVESLVGGAYLAGFLLIMCASLAQFPDAPQRSFIAGEIENSSPLIIALVAANMLGLPLIYACLIRLRQNDERPNPRDWLNRSYLLLISVVGIGLTIGAPILGISQFVGIVLLAAYLFFSWIVIRASKAKRTDYHPALLTMAAVLGCIVFALHFQWQHATDASVTIEQDITWMNSNLTENDKVMLFDGRMFMLHRKFVPMDHIDLEKFAKTDSTEEALAELRRLEITHFYYSEFAAKGGLADALSRKSFLFPDKTDKHFEIVHRSKHGWVAKLRPKQ